jgi:uncharacterized protein
MYKRIIEESIKSSFFKGKVVILYGPRQVGKTTLSKKILGDFDGQSKYIQCDIPSQRDPLLLPEPAKLRDYFGNVKLVVMDEAQLIPNIGTVLKTFIDTYPEIQIIATGSSSFDLANKVREPLTGRAFEFFLYPLSLEETSENDLFKYKGREEFYMRFGWYPGIVKLSELEASTELEVLQQNTMYKDIFTIENIRKPAVLQDLVRYLAFHIGSTVTVNNMANELKTSAKTIERYLDLLEKMFVIIRLNGFSRNLSNEIKKGLKVYFIDIGLRNSIIKNHNDLAHRNDVGGLFENFWILERIKYQSNHKILTNKYFWKTYGGIEVDYIEEANGALHAFECKYTKQSSKSILLFENEYKGAKTSIVTKENYIQKIAE